MTLHPHIGSQNSRERQREMMAQAERSRPSPSRWSTGRWAPSGPWRSAELAVAVHRGALADLDRTYGAPGTYVARREIGADGPIRENYLVTEFDTDDESRHVTEVCWPVSGTMPPP
jgi:hypothetical protein